MKAKNLFAFIQKYPDAEVIFLSKAYDDDALSDVSTVHIYYKGGVVPHGENFTGFIDDETGTAVVDLIVVS